MVTIARRWDGTAWVGSTIRRWDGIGWTTVHPPDESVSTIPQIVGTSAGGRANSGTYSVPLPAGAAGYIAVVRAEGTESTVAPSGWVQVSTPSGSRRLYVASAPTTPGTSWQMTEWGGVAVVIVGYLTPVTVSQVTEVSSLISPSITTSGPGLVLRVVMDLPDPPYGVTYPSNAPLGRAHYNAETLENYSALVGVAHSEQEAPGATGTAAWNFSGSYGPNSWTAFITAA